MRHLLLVLLLAFAIIAGTISGAKADGVAFPPANCSAAQPFMSFNGPVNNNNTYCSDGQFVLTNALPNCTEGQEVVFSGGKFICQTDPSSKVPTCGQDQVLTYNGADFICVNRTDKIPTCGTDQFLTYNGTAYQCATIWKLQIPNCGGGQVLTGNGSQLYCVNAPGGPYASCTEYCVNGFCVARQSDEQLEGPGNWQPAAVRHGVFATINDPQTGCASGWQCDNGTWIPSGCSVGTGSSGTDGVGGGTDG
jgi:hypothetical protein